MTSTNAEADRVPQHLSLTQAGDVLGVSRWTVRRMVEAGELDATDVRGMLRVVTASVHRYIAEHAHNNDEGRMQHGS